MRNFVTGTTEGTVWKECEMLAREVAKAAIVKWLRVRYGITVPITEQEDYALIIIDAVATMIDNTLDIKPEELA